MEMQLNIVSFNCRGFKGAIQEVIDLSKSFDILFLQETWLPQQDSSALSRVSEDFIYTSNSPVDLASGPLIGRPYGGLAIFWRKSLAHAISLVKTNDKRLLGVTVTDNLGVEHLLLNVYMPVSCSANSDLFIEYLGRIKDIYEECKAASLMVVGDFNADVGSNFYTYLSNFCEDENFVIKDVEWITNSSIDDTGVFTYVSDAHGTTSWLDHVVCSGNVSYRLSNFVTLPQYQCSDHVPLAFAYKLCVDTMQPHKQRQVEHECHKPLWNMASTECKDQYSHLLSFLLLDVSPPALDCMDSNMTCDSVAHVEAIDVYIADIIESIKIAEVTCITRVPTRGNRNFRSVVGWNDRVKHVYLVARKAFLDWVSAGKPCHGELFERRKAARHEFKTALKTCRNQEENIVADRLAEKLLDNDTNRFWDEVRKQRSQSLPTATRVASSNGPMEICSLWRKHYSELFNSVNSSSLDDTVLRHGTGPSEVEHVTRDEIIQSLDKLGCNKACGLDGVCVESMKNGPIELHSHLASFVSMCLSHSTLSKVVADVFITPILKGKSCDISDKNSYRPIAISSAISKLVESVLRNRLLPFIGTCHNQMGYKTGVGTETCVFLVKEFAQNHISSSGFLHAVFLDASKAFDKVNHRKLFRKLESSGVPMYICRFLLNCYRHQRIAVKWDGEMSTFFGITNGVRQGSLLSPMLFALYLDELSKDLNEVLTGCLVGTKHVNHLIYADDIVLFSPSLFGLRRLVKTCERYACAFDISFNPSKSLGITFSKRKLDFVVGSVYLNGNRIAWNDNIRYLGFRLNAYLDDRFEIDTQVRNFYARANSICRNFVKCSNAVKLKLFETFCSNFYLVHLWINFPQYVLNRCKVAYNNMIRKLLQLPPFCSASEMLVFHRIDSFVSRIRRSRALFFTRLAKCNNEIVRSVMCSDIWMRSNLHALLRAQTL